MRAWRALALLLVAGCLEPTRLLVDVTTDLPCDRNAGVSITVGAPGEVEEASPTLVTRECRDGTIGGLAVVPQGDRQAAVAVRVALSVGGNVEQDCTPERRYVGCVVSRRKVRFLPQRTVRVPVALYANCRDVPCDPDSTCSRSGQCVSSTVPPPDCAGAECVAPLDDSGGGAAGGSSGGFAGGASGGSAGGTGGGSAGGTSGGSAGGTGGGSAGGTSGGSAGGASGGSAGGTGGGSAGGTSGGSAGGASGGSAGGASGGSAGGASGGSAGGASGGSAGGTSGGSAGGSSGGSAGGASGGSAGAGGGGGMSGASGADAGNTGGGQSGGVAQGAPVVTMPTELFLRANVPAQLQIIATNSPTSYAASGLPMGLSVNPMTGRITGTPGPSAASMLTLSATNASGTGQQTVTLRVATPLALISATGTAPFVYSDLGRVDRLSPSDWFPPGMPAPSGTSVVVARAHPSIPRQIIAVTGNTTMPPLTEARSSLTGFDPWTVEFGVPALCSSSNQCLFGLACSTTTMTCGDESVLSPEGARISYGGPSLAFATPLGIVTQRGFGAATTDLAILPLGGALVTHAATFAPTANSHGLVTSENWVFSFKENIVRYSDNGGASFVFATSTSWPFTIALDFQVRTSPAPTVYALGASSMPGTAFIAWAPTVPTSWTGTTTVPFACVPGCGGAPNPYQSVGLLSVTGAALYVSVYGGASGWELHRAPLTAGLPGAFVRVHQSGVVTSPKPGRVVEVSNGELLYAVDGQLFRSQNGGMSWQAVGPRFPELWPQLAPL